LLNDFANFVNDYKAKHEMSIFSIMRRSKTTIIVSKVTILTSLINIIVLVLLPKKRDQSSKIAKNALMPKKRDRLPKVKTTTNNKEGNDVKTSS